MGVSGRVAGMDQYGLASGHVKEVPDVLELGGGILLPAMADDLIDPRRDAGYAVCVGLPLEFEGIADQFPVLIQGPVGPRRRFLTALKDEQWGLPSCGREPLAGQS